MGSQVDRFGDMSDDRAELLRRLIESRARKQQEIKAHPRSDAMGPVRLPATRAQQRLWFIDHVENGSAVYQMPLTIRLRGTLNRKALQDALDALVKRHEVLRTTFVCVDGELLQEISPSGTFPLELLDLSDIDVAEREEQVLRHKKEEVHQKSDLRHGPLVRGRLLVLGIREHVLLITLHHVVSDYWSKGVLLRELEQLYAACRMGDGDVLPPLPIQYADYALWQHRWMQGETVQAQLRYWRSQLEGCAPSLDLPTDRPRPPVQSYRGGNIDVVLSAQLTTRLKQLAQRHQTTLFMVLCAGWAILLARLSGQDDILIGTPVANRQRPEVEGLIGLFVNTLVLRFRVRGDVSLEEFLRQVRETTLAAYDHQDVPFEKVVEVVRPERTLSRNPLFQVVFALQNTPKTKPQLPELDATVEQAVDAPAAFDLLLPLEERGEELGGSLNYAADLFDRETIERWVASYTRLLKSMTEDPTKAIGELESLPPGERHQVLYGFNPTRVAYGPDAAIHELLESQVRRTPEAIAVTCEDRALTYAELNECANQLAAYLREKGVGPDVLVALYMERSIDMVVGVVGILKAGGAYLPLDPNYPMDRLAYMLEDAEPGVLLTQERMRARLPDTTAVVVAIDADWNEISTHSAANVASKVRPHHLAYVIYTSGSTGKPKGVMIEHRNVTRLFESTRHWFDFSHRDVWTLFHSIAFDFSVWELWGALLHGGRLVVVPHAIARSPEEFYQLLCREQVTVLNQTPSAFLQLIPAEARFSERHALRVVIFGGEALELHSLRPWVARNGVDAPQLVNMYGITETTVHVTYRRLTRADIDSERASLIGEAIPDLRVYLLDPWRKPVPIGVTGEIHVGGSGVARGYLNRPELTAERFVTDTFGSDSGQLLYKSGDLARWRRDGGLEYLGRNDHQIKIRGFRIELGEIEAQLARHEKVRDAVVLARDDAAGFKRLVAYLTPRGTSRPMPEELRTHLKAALPDYMVPSAFVMLDSLPLTTNGKLDRQKLPAPDLDRCATEDSEPPQGEVEEELAKIWRDLLHVERIGRHDNFFDLGGHSLLATSLASRVRQALDIDLPLRALFEGPTIQAMGHLILARIAEDVVSMEAAQ